MSPAARLDTHSFLDATWDFFRKRQASFEIDLECENDIQVDSNKEVLIVPLEIVGHQIAFCQGVEAISNSWFPLPLHPARGDILTIESNILKTDRVIHGDAWTVPIGNRRYLLGATYERFFAPNHDESRYDANASRKQLIARFESVTDGSFEEMDHRVIDQQSAVRPASYDRHPLVGSHLKHPNVFCMNGLGSKGTLMAPAIANHLLDNLRHRAIDPSLNWMRRRG